MWKLFLGQEVVSIKSAGAGTIKVCTSLGFSIKKIMKINQHIFKTAYDSFAGECFVDCCEL